MAARKSLSLLLQVALLGMARSTPYTILTSGKGFCRMAEVPKDTVIKVLFWAPDILEERDGHPSGPAYLTISEKPSQSALEAIEEEKGEERHRHPGGPGRIPPPMSHEMKQKEGSFVHAVKQDAELNICIRASTAATKNPQRFSFRLMEMGEEEAAESHLPPAKSVDHHLSFMEQQFDRIESQMHAVLREADFARERDSIYHTKTDAMHKATIFWPIVHVGILLVTGFTQANHIVQFFKKRRII